jgi:hypothetical protein
MGVNDSWTTVEYTKPETRSSGTRSLSRRPHLTCPTNKSRATKRLEILALRSLELADRAAAGQLPFIDAVDMAYSAAHRDRWRDGIQLMLSASFANARRL